MNERAGEISKARDYHGFSGIPITKLKSKRKCIYMLIKPAEAELEKACVFKVLLRNVCIHFRTEEIILAAFMNLGYKS